MEEWVTAILAAGPRAIRLQKALMREWEELGLSEAVERGIDAFAEAYATTEPAERMAEFLAKRVSRTSS
jgi:enoyl-CoA hydratase